MIEFMVKHIEDSCNSLNTLLALHFGLITLGVTDEVIDVRIHGM